MLGRVPKRWNSRGPTGIVMMNMGGPATLDKVEPFLYRLFTDPEIIQLGPFQQPLGSWISKNRAPKIQKQYNQIGGGSPIGMWTAKQGEGMVKALDKLRPETAPHKFYTAFRYADPLTEEALLQMKEDGIERAIAFSQYPQFSCTTVGSSMNHLWRELKRLDMESQFKWSVIDRWPQNKLYLDAVAERVRDGLSQFDADRRDRVVIVFSSHSLPQKIVERGDHYPQEMAGSVQGVMERINYSNSYVHAWQSKVGFLPWIVPGTENVLKGLGKQGHRDVLVVPIGFTSDHVETLYELDIEYKEAAFEAGIENYIRAESLNDSPLFIDALADVVDKHIETNQVCTTQYQFNCAHCVNPMCRTILNPIKPYESLRSRNGVTVG